MVMMKKYAQSKHSKNLSKLKLEFLEYYSKLPIQKLAADFIGKDEDTITNWKKKDKDFRMMIASVKSQWALNKVSMVKKSEWLLERILKEHFAEKKEVEHTTGEKLDEALERLSRLLPN